MTEPEEQTRPHGGHADRRARRRRAWHVGTVAVFALAGGLFVTSSLDSKGLDLRASSVTDLDTVVRQERDRVDGLQHRVAELSKEVDQLGSVNDAEVRDLRDRVDQLRGPAGFEAVHGPAVTVTLSDAPKDKIKAAVASGEVQADELVVHQQDIQAVVNALWTGGAEAMTVQGQRVISTTGIKCVGNTVILHGVPYAPPYRITAIGDTASLRHALDASDYIAGYRSYVDTLGLGYRVNTQGDVRMPAYQGNAELRYARGSAPLTARPSGR